ncbi:MAG: STAS domain-containing protein [Ornithinibacter sp.]
MGISTGLPDGGEKAVNGEGERVHVETRAASGVLSVSIAGEVDLWTLDQLTRRLRDLDLDDGAHVRLELTRLRFADVAAVRVLAGFARHARDTGHPLTTQGAGNTLRKVASLLGVLDDLGLV